MELYVPTRIVNVADTVQMGLLDPDSWCQQREWRGLPFRISPPAAFSSDADICMHESMLWVMDRGRSDVRWCDQGLDRQRLLIPGTAVFWRKGVRLTDIETRGPHASLAVLFPHELVQRWLEDEAAPTLAAIEGIGAHCFRLDPSALHAMRAMAADIGSGCPMGAAYSESISLALVTYLASTWKGMAGPGARQRPERAAVQKIDAFIEDNLSVDLSLSTLARVACLSPRQLARCFKTAKGISVHQYILQRRIERAKSLLAHQPVSRIALDLGFASPSHFSSAFHTLTGVTPSRFRQQS